MEANRSMIIFLFTSFLAIILTAAEIEYPMDDENAIMRRERTLDFKLAAQFSKNQPQELYTGSCTDEHYREWYFNKFSLDCRLRFSNASTLHELFEVYCDPLCGDLYFDYIDQCGNTGLMISIFYRSLCTANEKGITCYNYLTSEGEYNPKPDVDEHCDGYNSTCDEYCFDALDSFSLELGCCVNTLYNMSTPDHSTRYQLWDACDIHKPTFCDDIGRTTAGAKNLESSLNILSIALMMLVMAAMK